MYKAHIHIYYLRGHNKILIVNIKQAASEAANIFKDLFYEFVNNRFSCCCCFPYNH